jgi:mRNA interferase RelE/StbE
LTVDGERTGGSTPRTGYRIGIKRRATKYLANLPKDIRKAISDKIDGLVNDPRPNGCEKITDSDPPTWRIRVGDYRFLYVIKDEEHSAMVHDIGNRNAIYGKGH